MERSLKSFMALKKDIPSVADKYDLIVIDTPPSLGLFTVSALLAATHALVPVQPSFFCQEGLGDLNSTISLARESNPGLVSVRYFITFYDKRTVLNQELVGLLERSLGEQLLHTRIRKNIAIEESQYAQKTIFDYAPRSTGAADYRSLADEVWAWLGKT
jgi:chromosome partitioning protein